MVFKVPCVTEADTTGGFHPGTQKYGVPKKHITFKHLED